MALVGLGDCDRPGLGMPGLHLRSAPRALLSTLRIAATSAAEDKMRTELPIPSSLLFLPSLSSPTARHSLPRLPLPQVQPTVTSGSKSRLVHDHSMAAGAASAVGAGCDLGVGRLGYRPNQRRRNARRSLALPPLHLSSLSSSPPAFPFRSHLHHRSYFRLTACPHFASALAVPFCIRIRILFPTIPSFHSFLSSLCSAGLFTTSPSFHPPPLPLPSPYPQPPPLPSSFSVLPIVSIPEFFPVFSQDFPMSLITTSHASPETLLLHLPSLHIRFVVPASSFKTSSSTRSATTWHPEAFGTDALAGAVGSVTAAFFLL
ncbi:hypothetical protein B0H14DRAFT_3853555 [Mycena olivaceomarginata]|nr:hypothetical protein B0H14DRAFT_3853555 [Mycena olivaceomarginata]